MRSLLEFVTFLTFVCTSDVCHTNKCITFSIGSGTGCDWMCNYCAQTLGPNYYFTTPVCAYQSGGCVGTPIAGIGYTCCSV